MEHVYPEFIPDADLSREAMEDMQHRIAEIAVFEDRFTFDLGLEDVLVAGIDQAFLDDTVISGVVVMQNGEVMERVHSATDTEIPYIPGLLSFREGNAMLAALDRLSETPDVLVVDGSGRIHFRQAGIATHTGVVLDMPSIGVAKKLLCGHPVTSVSGGIEAGKRVPIEADNRVTADPGTVIGYAYQSRQYPGDRYINPLYVSPGHRVGAGTAVDIVEQLCAGYKLPEPTRLADRYVDQVKEDIRETDQQ